YIIYKAGKTSFTGSERWERHKKGTKEGVPLQNLPYSTKLDFLAKRKSFPSTVMSLFQPLERMFHLLECTFHRLERMFHQLEYNFCK
ncbi:MAG: hypothetical protein IKZ17_00640, partial [Bacteroidaceae bacterium]|nr:hypothetical protein [Bacteroidaceae bacterium]